MPVRMPLNHGDVILVPFPFADLSGSKVRPAVIVSANPQGPELILAFITSVMTNRSPRGVDIELRQADPEFAATGLKADSLIRLDKLVTVARSIVSRRLGVIGTNTKTQTTTKLRLALGL